MMREISAYIISDIIFIMETIRLDYGPFKQRPTPGVRFVVRRNAASLLQMISDDLSTWSLNFNLRLGILTQLYNFTLCCEDGVTPYIQKIVRLLFRHVDDDSKEVQTICLKTAYALGLFVPADVLIPYFMEAIFSRNTPGVSDGSEGVFKQSLRNALRLLIAIVEGTDKGELGPHVGSLVSLLGSQEFENNESTEVAEHLLLLADTIMDAAKANSQAFKSSLFSAILNISGSMGTAVHVSLKIKPIRESR